MDFFAFSKYIDICGNRLFTVVMLPSAQGRFPTVVCRSPYVNDTLALSDETAVQNYLKSYQSFLRRGYAVVFQHCRGRGKSGGDFVPYIFEREDGLEFRKWIRKQPFYNGELFLRGTSYTASLHYATAPFEKDILGAVFEVQDSERYNLWYRNGQMRKGHANWHFGLYKWNSPLKKPFDISAFSDLPLKGLSQRVLGESAEDFEQMLEAQSPADEFWKTRFGGAETKDAVSHADIPILLCTGYNDFYIGGVFAMWKRMDGNTKAKSALLVSPYNHGDGRCGDNCPSFKNGKRAEQFGADYRIDWFDSIRKGTPLPFPKGRVSYYRTFEDRWQDDFYGTPAGISALRLGTGARTFRYDPYRPTAFAGEGKIAGEDIGPDFITHYTEPFDRDIFVKGQMSASLSVSSSAPDTSFYIRISLKKADYTYVLRHDITSIGFAIGDYTPGNTVSLDFTFDEYAFLIKAGEQLRIDIASTDYNGYISHTNRKGPYYLQTGADIAENTVYPGDSFLYLPVEE